ncbi:hypothetical protein J4479_00935 [Candidatus Woesearchaeota archaeon]|nr:hypothetical protein [Candidatus Woesearchaeota archaeon]
MKEEMPQLTVRYNGLFDFDGLYAAVIDWAKNEGYMWHERTFKHKVPRPYGAEQELDWEITKNVTDFFQFGIAIRVHIWDLKEVEVQTEKGKKKLSQARVLIVMNGKLVTDWKRRFARGVFNKLLGKWYDKINYSKIGGYADTLAYRMLSLQAIIKKYFNMQTKKNVY